MIITRKQSLKNLKLQISQNQFYGEIYPATDQTFLFCCVIKIIDTKKYNRNLYIKVHLIHCDYKGTAIFQYPLIQKKKYFSSKYIQLSMFSDNEVLVVLPQTDILFQIHLRTHEIMLFNHKLNYNYGMIELHIFSKINVVCIQEIFQDDLRLTYLNLPLALGAKPITVYNSKIQSKYIRVRKANNHSMIIWFSFILTNLENKFVLNIFDLRDYPQGKYYRIETQYFSIINLEKINVNAVWQKKSGQFLLHICPPYQKTKIVKLDVQTNFISETQIDLYPSQHKDRHREIALSINNLGQFCWINKILEVKKSEYVYQFLIYPFCFSNLTQQMIEVQANGPYLFRKNCNYIKDYLQMRFPPFKFHQCRLKVILRIKTNHVFNPRLISILQYEENDNFTKLLSIKTTQLFNCYQVSLYFLIHLNEDFDDDLLKDSVELINYTQKGQIKKRQNISETIYGEQVS